MKKYKRLENELIKQSAINNLGNDYFTTYVNLPTNANTHVVTNLQL